MRVGWALHEPPQQALRLGKVYEATLALSELRARMRWGVSTAAWHAPAVGSVQPTNNPGFYAEPVDFGELELGR